MNRLITFILFGSIMFSLIAPFSKAEAQVTRGFGGISTVVIPCTCTGSFMITMLNGATGIVENFIYNPMITLLYANFLVIKPGTYTLGLVNTMPITCPTGPTCAPAGIGFQMLMVGTSL